MLNSRFFTFLILFRVSLGLAVNNGQNDEDTWGYDRPRDGKLDPRYWYLKYEQCQGNRQSPVNIGCDNIFRDANLDQLTFINYDTPVEGLNMHNDGSTIKIDVPASAGLEIRSNYLPAAYRLSQFHFHWGTPTSGGSEHRIHGQRWPLEMHLVHVGENIPANQTLMDKNALVVISVLIDVARRSGKNGDFDELAKFFPHVNNEDDHITLPPFVIMDLLPYGAGQNYLRYSGSLTTPPCAEVVEWFILTQTMTVTKDFMKKLRGTRTKVEKQNGKIKEPLIRENDRPLQPLMDRPIRLHGNFGNLPACYV